MSGGKGNIKPEDGVQFGEGNKAAEKWSEFEALAFGEELLTWMRAQDENIFFSDFIYLSCDQTKYRGKITGNLPAYLAKKFTSFSELLEIAKEIEKIKLKKFAAFDKLNAGFVKFLLNVEYGMVDQSNIDHKTNGKDLPAATFKVEIVKPDESED